eukprot:CAMPEP_0203990952 /NCGR_PEP_ID=MMETSP0360-20130528/9180_1 /ASSEMBLY_ACC=CAM_ASM_000342 /TAXON_ID=268821 /ORGANISM="Scrippsiella Hangoei, Strain SHTV-5" /LENGTH=194 /DNA_ID=CAMNT_0050931093 /DNA_START=239 /DNA_END=820 /DNA_ORIENTATION=-
MPSALPALIQWQAAARPPHCNGCRRASACTLRPAGLPPHDLRGELPRTRDLRGVEGHWYGELGGGVPEVSPTNSSAVALAQHLRSQLEARQQLEAQKVGETLRPRSLVASSLGLTVEDAELGHQAALALRARRQAASKSRRIFSHVLAVKKLTLTLAQLDGARALTVFELLANFPHMEKHAMGREEASALFAAA